MWIFQHHQFLPSRVNSIHLKAWCITEVWRWFVQPAQGELRGADSGACLSALPLAGWEQEAALWAGSTMAQHLMATVQYFCAVISLPSSPSDMIIRSLFEQLTWAWMGSSWGRDPSSASTAVNYHWTPRRSITPWLMFLVLLFLEVLRHLCHNPKTWFL